MEGSSSNSEEEEGSEGNERPSGDAKIGLREDLYLQVPVSVRDHSMDGEKKIQTVLFE